MSLINTLQKLTVEMATSIKEKIYDKQEVDGKIADLKLRTHVGEKLDYCFAILETTSVTLNQNIIFKKKDSNLDVNDDGTFLLKANKRYKIYTSIITSSTANYYTYALFTSDGIKIQDSAGYSISASYTGSNSTSSTKPSVVIVKFNEDTLITVKGVTNIGGGQMSGSIIIEEIGREVLINEVEEVAKSNHIEDTPVGHIMSTMSLTAPPHYLVCDGAEYNIEDYPKLAEHFKNEFGSINYFGGDGTNTFAVPDMRGEFVRGYDSENIRDPEGSARGIGKHQDATKFPNIFSKNNYIETYKNSQGGNFVSNYDHIENNEGNNLYLTGTEDTRYTGNYAFTSRPTNVNVLFCIKYEPTYFMNYSPMYGGFDKTVLFEGEANAISSYSLNDDIKYYSHIEVYSTINNNHSDYIKINVDDALNYDYDTGVFCLTTAYYIIRFNLNDNKLNILEIIKGTDWNSLSPKIFKIIGIKANSNTIATAEEIIVNDIVYSDEEIKLAIDNIKGCE